MEISISDLINVCSPDYQHSTKENSAFNHQVLKLVYYTKGIKWRFSFPPSSASANVTVQNPCTAETQKIKKCLQV